MGLGKTIQTLAFLHSYHRHFRGPHIGDCAQECAADLEERWKNESSDWLSRTEDCELTADKVRLSSICYSYLARTSIRWIQMLGCSVLP